MTTCYTVRPVTYVSNGHEIHDYGDGDDEILGVHATREAAETVYAGLTVRAFRRFEKRAADQRLEDYTDFVEQLSDATIQEANRFCRAACGRPLVEEASLPAASPLAHGLCYLPPGLADPDIVTLAGILGRGFYRLVPTDGDAPIFSLWLVGAGKFLTDARGAVIHALSVEPLLCDWNRWDQGLLVLPQTLSGGLADLSDAPEQLQALLDTRGAGMSYDAAAQRLSIRLPPSKAAGLLALNALLREPLFDIRESRLGELAAGSRARA